MHWINVVALTLLFMSGLQIFNAHPALYWGESSYTGAPPLLEIGASEGARAASRSATRACSATNSTTTGVLGVSTDDGRHVRRRAFRPG